MSARPTTTLRLDNGTATWITADTVTVGDRRVPSAIDVHLESHGGQPELRMRIEVRNGVPMCVSVQISAVDGGREVRSLDLKAVRISEWVEDIVSGASTKIVAVDEETGEVTSTYSTDPQALLDARRAIQGARRPARRNVDRLLPEVAEIYRAHFDDRPVEAVAAAFGISYRNAGRYVQLAREAGLLPPTTPGKKRV